MCAVNYEWLKPGLRGGFKGEGGAKGALAPLSISS